MIFVGLRHLSSNRTLVGRAGERCELGEHAALVAGFGLLPGRAATGNLGRVHVQSKE